jgi:hypothetical protein
MQLQERAKMLGSDAKHRMREAKLERADRERDRLRAENQLMRERIEHTDEELFRALDAIDNMAKIDGSAARKPRKHRIRRLFVLGAAAGSAYVMGAKAGRERYESLRRRWTEMRGRARTMRDDAMDGAAARSTATGDQDAAMMHPSPSGAVPRPSPDPTRSSR